jgi:hypothetical protein
MYILIKFLGRSVVGWDENLISLWLRGEVNLLFVDLDEVVQQRRQVLFEWVGGLDYLRQAMVFS